MSITPLKPRIVSEYVHIYRPEGDVFPGPDTKELKAEVFYEDWVPNDHGFIKGQDGAWHVFGITHPYTVGEIHEGENLSFHARAPEGTLQEVLKDWLWKDLPKVLPPGDRPNEIDANHAPFFLVNGDTTTMFYGPTPIRTATSTDLNIWTPRGPVTNSPHGRDPNILKLGDTHCMCVCSNGISASVIMSMSEDLIGWRDHKKILTLPEGVEPESPFLLSHNNTFYLFVCGWDKRLPDPYQYITYVFQSDHPARFDGTKPITTLKAHAPEIIIDEEGDWFISSAEYPHRGVSIARLGWE